MAAYWSQAFAVQAALQSKGQIIMARNAGIPGNTTAQMDARFATDVTPYAAQIDAVFLLAGTNDSGVTALPAWIASMKSIIGKIRALGKQPIMATIPRTITSRHGLPRSPSRTHGFAATPG
jgi:lysophospholipase L1-like esterase